MLSRAISSGLGRELQRRITSKELRVQDAIELDNILVLKDSRRGNGALKCPWQLLKICDCASGASRKAGEKARENCTSAIVTAKVDKQVSRKQ